ncbi:hypothetical protein BJY04DRAFT_42320 [Aspergillus karnatakaensis]|uniref:uncharacterized protein n=1 Tax=Aspergillus karnatakaensis TaxID=1810916 RepID=UPI003CCD4037
MPSNFTAISCREANALALIQIKAIIYTIPTIPNSHKDYLLGPDPCFTCPKTDQNGQCGEKSGLIDRIILPEHGKRPVVQATATISYTGADTPPYTLSVTHGLESAFEKERRRNMQFEVRFKEIHIGQGQIPLPTGCRDWGEETESYVWNAEEFQKEEGEGVPRGMGAAVQVRRVK